MKAKTIKAVIGKKMNEWWDSIEDVELRELVKKNTIVTGGAIASMLLKEKVNDFDVYFRDRDTALQVAKYYVQRFTMKDKQGIPAPITVQYTADRVMIVIKSAGIASEEGTDKPYQYFESRPADEAANYVGDVMSDPGDIEDAREETDEALAEVEDTGKAFRPVFLSTNAITLASKVQLILRFFGDPEEIHKNYDFAHCTNYWSSWDGKLTLHQAALESLLAKELRYVGSKYPVASIFRIRKFIARGWTINAGQILKIIMQIQELDLKDVNVLRDQLTGVDVAYFLQVIELLQAKDPQKVNSAYLIEIIDRMF